VTLSEGFHISATEVTQGLYAAVTGGHPWRDKPNGTDWDAGECYHVGEMAQGNSQPAYCVSWFDAVAFCNALSELEGLKPAYDIAGTTVKRVAGASGYRLPTEAEWEYAARAGESHTYAGSDDVDDVAWYDGNSDNQTQPVGQKDANAWGLHDMSGNVYEWTGDWYASDYYTSSPAEDPQGAPSTGDYRVNRGGGFHVTAVGTRAAYRSRGFPDNAGDYLGFRVVLPE
jgi:formylglycine-generating enzyme required for sulfatase activity